MVNHENNIFVYNVVWHHQVIAGCNTLPLLDDYLLAHTRLPSPLKLNPWIRYCMFSKGI